MCCDGQNYRRDIREMLTEHWPPEKQPALIYSSSYTGRIRLLLSFIVLLVQCAIF